MTQQEIEKALATLTDALLIIAIRLDHKTGMLVDVIPDLLALKAKVGGQRLVKDDGTLIG